MAISIKTLLYLISLRISESLLVHTQMAHFGHQFIRVNKETGTEQECEDVCPLGVKKMYQCWCNNTNH